MVDTRLIATHNAIESEMIYFGDVALPHCLVTRVAVLKITGYLGQTPIDLVIIVSLSSCLAASYCFSGVNRFPP